MSYAAPGLLHPGRQEHKLLDVAPPHRLSWMSLLARVFRVDVSICQRFQGPMRVVRAVSSPDEIAEAPPPIALPIVAVVFFGLFA